MHQARHVIARVPVRDVAADGAAIPHLRIGNLKRRFAQDRQRRSQIVIGDQFVLGHHRADVRGAAADCDALHVFDGLKINEMAHFGHAQFHHRDKAVSACDDARFVSVFG